MKCLQKAEAKNKRRTRSRKDELGILSTFISLVFLSLFRCPLFIQFSSVFIPVWMRLLRFVLVVCQVVGSALIITLSLA